MKANKESGQVSRLLLVLAIIVLVAAVIVYLVMRMAERPASPAPNPTSQVQMPVYEYALTNIRFVSESALDKGGVLRASEVVNSQYDTSYQKDLLVSNSGAKFIRVTVGAQNIGTENIEQGAWDLGDIVDSQGRKFVATEGYTITPWLPNPNLCGALLKPAFDPTPCTKIYEVSKASTGLKVVVETGKNNTAQNFSSGKIDSYLIDLIVK